MRCRAIMFVCSLFAAFAEDIASARLRRACRHSPPYTELAAARCFAAEPCRGTTPEGDSAPTQATRRRYHRRRRAPACRYGRTSSAREWWLLAVRCVVRRAVNRDDVTLTIGRAAYARIAIWWRCYMPAAARIAAHHIASKKIP